MKKILIINKKKDSSQKKLLNQYVNLLNDTKIEVVRSEFTYKNSGFKKECVHFVTLLKEAQVVLNESYDFIVVENVWFLLLAKMLFRKSKIIYYFHEFESSNIASLENVRYFKLFFFFVVEQLMPFFVDKMLVLSNKSERDFKKKILCNSCIKICIIPINELLFYNKKNSTKKKNEKITISYISNKPIEEEIIFVIDLFSKLKKRRHLKLLVSIPVDSLSYSIIKKYEQENLFDSLQFVHSPSERQKNAILNDSNVLLCSSVSEFSFIEGEVFKELGHRVFTIPPLKANSYSRRYKRGMFSFIEKRRDFVNKVYDTFLNKL